MNFGIFPKRDTTGYYRDIIEKPQMTGKRKNVVLIADE